MASTSSITVPDKAQNVHEFLRDRLSHIEQVSNDVLCTGDRYTAVLVYQHYFARVGNQVALIVMISGSGAKTTVKTVSCGASRGFFDFFDWGASCDFAEEPIEYLRKRYGACGS